MANGKICISIPFGGVDILQDGTVFGVWDIQSQSKPVYSAVHEHAGSFRSFKIAETELAKCFPLRLVSAQGIPDFAIQLSGHSPEPLTLPTPAAEDKEAKQEVGLPLVHPDKKDSLLAICVCVSIAALSLLLEGIISIVNYIVTK